MSRHPAHTSTCVFRVRIAGFCAPGYGLSIWREVELSADQSLAQLGDAIPPAFGFEDHYLRWSFFLSGKPGDGASEYARPSDPRGPTVSRQERGADGLRVDDAPTKMEFLFLFGESDDWSFGVKLVRTGEVEPGAAIPGSWPDRAKRRPSTRTSTRRAAGTRTRPRSSPGPVRPGRACPAAAASGRGGCRPDRPTAAGPGGMAGRGAQAPLGRQPHHPGRRQGAG